MRRLIIAPVFCLLVAGSFQSMFAADVAADRLFPDTTKGFFSITSLNTLSKQWNKTQIGKLMKDDMMQPFVKDVRRQIGERFTDQFGITLEGIEEIPSGELAAGLVVIPDLPPGFIFTMDISGREEKAKGYLDRLCEQFVGAGATLEKDTIGDEELVILDFPPKEETGKHRKAYYLITCGHLILADQQPLLELFAERLKSGVFADSLAEVPSYVQIQERLKSDLPKESEPSAQAADESQADENAEDKSAENTSDAQDIQPEEVAPQDGDYNVPLVCWYVEPLAYGKAISNLIPKPEKRKNKPLIVDVLAEQGFDAILGVGGVVSIKAEAMELVHRNYILAPKPYRLAMKMLSFPNGDDFKAPKWMPRDLASCFSLYVEPLDIFDNFGSLFDSLIMEEEGVWEDIIKGLAKDPNGPRIDIRKELVEHLGRRVLFMSKYTLPITVSSESLVVAVELKETSPPAVADALEKLFANDPEIQKSLYREKVIWQNKPPEDIIEPVSFDSGVPPLGGGFGPAPVKEQQDVSDVDEKRNPIFPKGGVTVANGCLFVGTNVEYLQEILDRFDEAIDSIADAADYKVVDLVFSDMGVTREKHCFQMFARTDETIRPTYELIREGKMPEAQTLLGKIVNSIATKPDTPKGTVRKQQIDGSKMPEFESIRRNFGPAGIYGVSEENGWFIKGFILEK
ncbi:MAG TPA: hypothetical protein DEB39_05375 [Planctomycetaceae bacterium]|nr:hypothetical protein [Planctomycetaceae bacterium]